MKLLERLFRKKKGEGLVHGETFSIDIWAALDGPFENDEGVWTLLVKVVVDGEMIVTELYFRSFEDGYNFFKTVHNSAGPVSIELPSDLTIAESEVIKWQQKLQ